MRISVTGRSPRVKMRSIRRSGDVSYGKKSSPCKGKVRPGSLGLVADQVSVIATAITSYAPVVVPGPLLRSPATTTGRFVAAGPIRSSVAWAAAIDADRDY